MSQLGDILDKSKYAEPPEIQQIKDFVLAEIGVKPKVTITSESLIVRMPSAAAAGALRMKIVQLTEHLDTKKRVVIRIS